MFQEKRRCYFCDTEHDLHDAFLNGEILDLCTKCMGLHGALQLKSPSKEQLSKAEKAVTLHDTVKQWRKEHQTHQELNATLETLRDRKVEIDKEKAWQKAHEPKPIQNFEREKNPKILNFEKGVDLKTMNLKIEDLRRAHQEHQNKKKVQEEEIEMDDFMQEIRRIKDEEKLVQELSEPQLEQELHVPVPIEPILPGPQPLPEPSPPKPGMTEE